MLKADLHIHTKYSMDCVTPLDRLVERCLELGINCVAIVDHGTVEGALKLKGIAPFKVIVAEEILTPDGEVMGMFLEETIPSGISVSEAISRIRAQGGLVCIPHPFDIFRPSAMRGKTLKMIAEQIDILEVFNARTLLFQSQNKAMSFAEKYGLKKSAGSDAHTLPEIGNAYVEMPEFNNRDEFLQALAQGDIHGHKTNPLAHFASLKNRVTKRLG
ncbi:MAG: PHP domain-containing protein [Chloroflexota bacterium]